MDASERARLRALIKDAALPWFAEHRGIVDDRGGTIVADLVEAGAAWGYVEPQGIIVGAVNALPATLDALDAADRAAERAEAESAALWDLLAETERERDRLRWGVVANAGRCSPERKPRWAHVAEATGEGSTSAHRMCVAAGFDPDEVRGILDEEGDGGDNAECDAARREGAEAMASRAEAACEAVRQRLAERHGAQSSGRARVALGGACEGADLCAAAIRALPLPGEEVHRG